MHAAAERPLSAKLERSASNVVAHASTATTRQPRAAANSAK